MDIFDVELTKEAKKDFKKVSKHIIIKLMAWVEDVRLLGVSRQYLCDHEHHRRFVSPKAAQSFVKKLGYSED